MATLALAAGCATAREATRPAADVEEGLASYYADALEGRPTASGEPYDHDAPTCAHRTHRLGTRLRVTAVGTGASVECRVNDRGPYVRGRVVDLSRSLAERLGMLERGVIRVRLERLR